MISNYGTLTVKHSEFTGNFGSGFAGAIDGIGTLIVKHSRFSDNYVSEFGGGAIVAAGTIDIDHSTFIGNGGASGGGGIQLSGFASVTASTFSENRVFEGGGGILNFGTLLITRSTVSENHAVYGGGIANFGALLITNSTLSENEASGFDDPFFTPLLQVRAEESLTPALSPSRTAVSSKTPLLIWVAGSTTASKGRCSRWFLSPLSLPWHHDSQAHARHGKHTRRHLAVRLLARRKTDA